MKNNNNSFSNFPNKNISGYRAIRFKEWIEVLTNIKNLLVSLLQDHSVQVTFVPKKGDTQGYTQPRQVPLTDVVYDDLALEGFYESGTDWRLVVFHASDYTGSQKVLMLSILYRWCSRMKRLEIHTFDMDLTWCNKPYSKYINMLLGLGCFLILLGYYHLQLREVWLPIDHVLVRQCDFLFLIKQQKTHLCVSEISKDLGDFPQKKCTCLILNREGISTYYKNFEQILRRIRQLS